ncbi:MAG TPA: endonuclease/exonuclease/phosphatase family protein [Pseudomonadales bacterium]|jgi:endonuclease/exonuclease/phosphatase family metal-dependent hydrolase|nr:endonuclease/exonuclease/phosphatase family protein [Pseudomonadales bacterium]MDP6317595.1 endonuclease/exonuclease/phosphatase family protein [Pseudomonadales bacterium]HJP50651.1 endonuclease/exonuclease/phosphatase family protein [Pseudomonadales bacterium]|tara:strand:- start:1027 stop:1752 length:726 start_codon:yes stop_codon:yes gene_type:complete
MTSPDLLRVCSYNIHKGFNTTNLRFLLSELRHAIQSVDADLVFLQEVVGKLRGGLTLQASQFEYLADSVWPHFAYGKNVTYQDGHYGNAILSKHRFVEFYNLNVSRWRFSQRGILVGRLINDTFLICVHFGLFAAERKHQVNILLNTLDRDVPADAPVIIAGDFNDWTFSTDREIKRRGGMKEVHSDIHGGLARTFPSPLPFLAMDRIYYRNLELVEVEVLSGFPWRRLSDHCALNAIFRE